MEEQRQQAAAYSLAKAKNDFIPRDPWRAINGETNYIKPIGVEFCGKVVDVTANGVRISGEFGSLFETHYLTSAEVAFSGVAVNYSDFFVANFPFEVVSEQVVSENQHLMAWYVGTYTYTTVNGASRTIKKLDYGTPCNPPPELIKQQIEAAKAKALLAKKKAEQAKATALKSNQDAAAKGDMFGLLRMGERYRDGDGVEKDLAKAKEYLQKAADAGSPTAAEELVKLKP